MCLSTIYVDQAPEPVGRNICKIRVENGEIVATDIMGRELRLSGTIDDVDLVENTVRIRTSAA